MHEPLLPQPSSLAPVETEAFRQRYGQEALFRLRLGVESGERTSATNVAPGADCADGWLKTPQAQRLQAALNQQQWYVAGEMLGRWRRQCGTGSAKNTGLCGLDPPRPVVVAVAVADAQGKASALVEAASRCAATGSKPYQNRGG